MRLGERRDLLGRRDAADQADIRPEILDAQAR